MPKTSTRGPPERSWVQFPDEEPCADISDTLHVGPSECAPSAMPKTPTTVFPWVGELCGNFAWRLSKSAKTPTLRSTSRVNSRRIFLVPTWRLSPNAKTPTQRLITRVGFWWAFTVLVWRLSTCVKNTLAITRIPCWFLTVFHGVNVEISDNGQNSHRAPIGTNGTNAVENDTRVGTFDMCQSVHAVWNRTEVCPGTFSGCFRGGFRHLRAFCYNLNTHCYVNIRTYNFLRGLCGDFRQMLAERVLIHSVRPR